MQVTGIVCEFNPFHLGHAYLISQLRQRGADAIVCAMSGNFVQRGEPALVNKLSRAEMAVACGADLVNFHLEATEDVKGCIEKIRATGKKVGITIKPATPAKAVEQYLELVDMVLVMTVEPGFGGQKLIPECLDKVQEIRKMIADKGLSTDLEVDGGIHLDNVVQALEKGANVIVAGSAVFKDDIAANAKAFLNRMQ